MIARALYIIQTNQCSNVLLDYNKLSMNSSTEGNYCLLPLVECLSQNDESSVKPRDFTNNSAPITSQKMYSISI